MYLTDQQIKKLAKELYGHLRKELMAQITVAVEEENDTIIGTKAAAQMLNIQPATLRRKCNNGEIPYTKKGRKLLFSKLALMRYIRN